MKKLFLMIGAAIGAILPFGKVNAYTCTYTYSDGTTGSEYIENKITQTYCESSHNYCYNAECPTGQICKEKDVYDYVAQSYFYYCYNENDDLIGGYTENIDCVGSFSGCKFSCNDSGCIYQDGNMVDEEDIADYFCKEGSFYYYGSCQECYNTTSCSYDRENDKWNVTCEEGYVQAWDDYECAECYGADSCSKDEDGNYTFECSAGYYQTCTDDYSCCDNECPEGASSCYLEDMDDEDSMVIDSCNNGYLEKDGSCISATAGCGAGYRQFENFCNRIQYTPAEAAKVLTDDNNNSVTITFKK